jgi:hypothetical protein
VSLGNPRRRRENSFNVIFKIYKSEGLGCFHLARDKGEVWVPVNTVNIMNVGFYTSGEFLQQLPALFCSTRALLHGVKFKVSETTATAS